MAPTTEKQRAAQRAWRLKNPGYGKAWRSENVERAREYERTYGRARGAATRAAWEEANANKRRDYHLKRRFNLPFGTYERLSVAQGGVCGICKKPPTRRWLDVDHCHRTGRIRGLLCNPCNRLLGFVEKYLENPAAFDRWMGR